MLASLQFRDITQRLQNPRAQFARAHWRLCSIQNGEQACVLCTARFNQLKVGLCGGVEKDVLRRCVAAQ
ncbi:MAG: hypothetical protein DMF26_02750 [Verrucomicrobia bacterium]|nr:MAG: hypothetical protein DMF26_02750 [Verrucomicrobiota bacterium]